MSELCDNQLHSFIHSMARTGYHTIHSSELVHSKQFSESLLCTFGKSDSFPGFVSLKQFSLIWKSL